MICDTCKLNKLCNRMPEDGEDGVQFCHLYIWDRPPDTAGSKQEAARSVPYTAQYTGKLCTEKRLCSQ